MQPLCDSTDLQLKQQQLLDLTNAVRAQAGCAPVQGEPLLQRVADMHAQAMAAAGYFPPGALRPPFASRSKITGLRHPPLRYGPPLRSGCGSVPPAVG